MLSIFAFGSGLNAEPLELHTRSRHETSKGNGDWQIVEKTAAWEPKQTAIVICDMWNQHWCKGATARVAEMAPRMNQVLGEARKRGVFIIHCPSDTMKYYEGSPWPATCPGGSESHAARAFRQLRPGHGP